MREIQHETRFYKLAGKVTGIRFMQETKKATNQIQKNPSMWPALNNRLRGNIVN